MKKIIIDTDPGIDDAIALFLAIKSNSFDIKAITTVCGNSTISNVTKNAQYLLSELKSSIPVYSGARKPLQRRLIKATVHGASGLTGITLPNKVMLTGDAVNRIIEIINRFPNEITIIALGPLTNIALAIKQNPKTMLQAKEIIIMGGAVNVSGNMRGTSEFNMFVDPEAADIVFYFPIKKTLVPLDICNQISLSLDDFRSIKKNRIRQLVLKMIIPYMRNLKRIDNLDKILMYDPLTIYCSLFPNKIQTSLYDLKIITKNPKMRGMTVSPTEFLKPLRGKINVVTSLSKRDFINYLVKTLSS